MIKTWIYWNLLNIFYYRNNQESQFEIFFGNFVTAVINHSLQYVHSRIPAGARKIRQILKINTWLNKNQSTATGLYPIDRHERVLYYYNLYGPEKRLKINNYSCSLNINKILSVVTYFS